MVSSRFPHFAKLLGVVVFLSVLILAGCGGGGSGSTSGSKPGTGINVIVGSKKDADGQLLASMYALLLQSKGYNVTTKLALGDTTVLDGAIKSGAVDIYPEFNGTALNVYKLTTTQDPQTAYNEAKAYYAQNFQLTWLNPALNLNDSYGICTSAANVSHYNLKSLSDLTPVASQLTLGLQQDAVSVYQPVYAAYGIHFKGTTFISEQLSFAAVTHGDIQVNECYTTDPAIVTNNFTLLTDPKNVFPPYNPSPVVRNQLISKSAAVATTLNVLPSHLTTAKITALIKQVSVDNKDPMTVAQSFLKSEGLI
jgi:osmoprotectant transport system substrate-binding protein